MCRSVKYLKISIRGFGRKKRKLLFVAESRGRNQEKREKNGIKVMENGKNGGFRRGRPARAEVVFARLEVGLARGEVGIGQRGSGVFHLFFHKHSGFRRDFR